MPVHNGEKFIGQALESALGQADVQLDVIVVDDASTDDTRSVVSSFGDRVRYLLVEKQVSSIATTNLGIAEARGELISILHRDDYYLPGKLSRHAAVMALDHRIGLAYSAQRYVDSDGSPLWTLRSPVARRDYVVEGVVESEPVVVQNYINFCNAVVRRSAYAAVGPFAEDLWFSAEWDMWLRLAPLSGCLSQRQPRLLPAACRRPRRSGLARPRRIQGPTDNRDPARVLGSRLAVHPCAGAVACPRPICTSASGCYRSLQGRRAGAFCQLRPGRRTGAALGGEVVRARIRDPAAAHVAAARRAAT